MKTTLKMIHILLKNSEKKLQMIKGEYTNIKITKKEDLIIFKKLKLIKLSKWYWDMIFIK